ncbi:MAG: CPBP family intramembrane metalloprotease [Oscillospiraceae bacterium]|nr:CPBP family intramembrane metalloprotease [Oscillospiraceae bacterium]
MNNKKLTVIRLVIFYTLAILPLIILTPIFSNLLGEPMFSGEAAAAQLTQTWGIIGMCCPALANVLTRVITREGLKDSYLKLDMKNGKWKYYLLAFGIPLFYMIITVFLVLLVYCRDAESWFAADQIPTRFWTYFSQLGTTLLLFLPFFGEEFGWRAYMTPKLEEILPMPAALVVGGILWGVWHAPLTVQGHNFGLDYPGFPFLGIFLMCVMCTAMGAILTLLTKRAQSVFPAAIMHGINNNMSFGVFLSMFGAEALSEHLETLNSPATMAIMIIPEAIIGAVCFVILCRDAKKEKAAGAA